MWRETEAEGSDGCSPSPLPPVSLGLSTVTCGVA
eukprot:gene3612-biopygen1467